MFSHFIDASNLKTKQGGESCGGFLWTDGFCGAGLSCFTDSHSGSGRYCVPNGKKGACCGCGMNEFEAAGIDCGKNLYCFELFSNYLLFIGF